MTRKQSHEIEIDAPKEAVWKAISEAEGLTRWYAEEARVTPGEGGEQWISWGGGQDMSLRHLAWKPNERIKVGHPDHEKAEGWGAIVVEMSIEDRGPGRTLLRLVQSGIPDDADWDSAYEGTEVGWSMFLSALKYYLEHQPGKPRRTIFRYAELKQSPEEAWRLLTGPRALGGGITGARYETKTAAGDVWTGEVLRERPGRVLVASIDQLDGLLMITLHPTKSGSYLNFILAAYGDKMDRIDALKDPWIALLDRALSLG